MSNSSIFIVGSYMLRLSDIDKMWHTVDYGEKQIRMFVGGSPLTLRGEDRSRFIRWLKRNADVWTDEDSWFDRELVDGE